MEFIQRLKKSIGIKFYLVSICVMLLGLLILLGLIVNNHFVMKAYEQGSTPTPATYRKVSNIEGNIDDHLDKLKAILDESMLSPTDFQNSVYNTAVSYASILFENKNEILTISSGDETSLKVLKAGAIKALDNDEVVLICSETINIPNIQEVNSCIDFLESVVALKVKISKEDSTINLENITLKGFPNSIKHLMFIAQNFDKTKKNIVRVDI